jgi:murein DD-endopeptidase MepM/ murein hydrolase activator NlpD
VRSRSPFVHALTLSFRRAGIVVPLAVAVGLAAVGHSVSTPAVRAATPVNAVVDRPERAVAGPSVRQSVVRVQPKRATRSTARRAVAAPRWVRPAHGPITSPYGMRWGKMHKGLDFGAPYGSPIYAAANGYVTFAGAQSGYGRLVTIRHAGPWTTAYGHMSRTLVHVGQHVTAGQVIAYVGSEGHSTGPHLHFEVRIGSSTINPYGFLRARGVL